MSDASKASARWTLGSPSLPHRERQRAGPLGTPNVAHMRKAQVRLADARGEEAPGHTGVTVIISRNSCGIGGVMETINQRMAAAYDQVAAEFARQNAVVPDHF